MKLIKANSINLERTLLRPWWKSQRKKSVSIPLSQEFDATMSTYGLVVEVTVTGVKKTIIIRSPIQVRHPECAQQYVTANNRLAELMNC